MIAAFTRVTASDVARAKRRPEVVIGIPILARPVSRRRQRRLLRTCTSLAASLAQTPAEISIQAIINGPSWGDTMAVAVNTAFKTAFEGLSHVSTLIERTDHFASKISAVNSLVENTQKYDAGLLVIDDDIIVPHSLVSECTLHQKAGCGVPLLFHKRAIRNNNTPFGRSLTYLFSDESMKILHQYASLPIRPTGACYFLPRGALLPMPNPCNEGEVLAINAHYFSSRIVHTWYPDTFEGEVERRTRQLITHVNTPSPAVTWKDKALFNMLEAELDWLRRIPRRKPQLFESAKLVRSLLQRVVHEVGGQKSMM